MMFCGTLIVAFRKCQSSDDASALKRCQLEHLAKHIVSKRGNLNILGWIGTDIRIGVELFPISQ